MSETLLATEGLTKRFEALTAVNDVSLEVPAGQITAIIGPNGAGKTTLFNLFTGKLRPTSGTIRFRGERIDGKSPHEIVQKGIARSYQITNFFPNLTVRENARLAAQRRYSGFGFSEFFRHYTDMDEPMEEAVDVLHDVGLGDVIDTPANNLSHGQRRHLEMALALAADPDLMLLDEPTAGMSPEETREMRDLIEEIAEEVTLILVEHDMDVVMGVSDRIAVMYRGDLITVGDPESVREDPEVQEAYLKGG